MNGLSGNIGAEALFDLTGADREAKAYAFLYAAFKRTEVSKNPVRDAIDCLVPFIAPYLETIPGKQIQAEEVCAYMRSKFGFDFPLYAMQQLISDLPRHGLAEYNRIAKAHIAKANVDRDFGVAKSDIETNFDHISDRLQQYANSLQFFQDPPSGTWGDALIHFLKGSAGENQKASIKIRGALIEAHKSEMAVVGSFISKLHVSDTAAFDKVLHIFLGVLVEEFISSVSEIGTLDNVDVIVLYDTAVVLRLLGTSGKLLRTATEELTRYLQDLGCKIYYFGGNEAEVENIFSTIVHIKDSGGELEGETASAISDGEVSISDIRMLQNSFPERLAALNVFPADNLETSAADNARFQIDERGFSAYLLEQANASGRRYGVDNRTHDAQYLGTVMRLRGGVKTRDFANSRFVFVTSNKFLATTSRRYLIKEKALQPQHMPPMLSVGQMATIAWLMKDRKLAPDQAGRELLANCFAAVRPDAEWFKHFREGMEKATGSVEAYGREATNTLTLQAARRIAQEESLGSGTLVRELNMAEILSRAEEQRRAESDRLAEEMAELKRATERQQENLLAAEEKRRVEEARQLVAAHADALALSKIEAENAADEMVRRARIESSEHIAKTIVFAFRYVLLGAFVITTAYAFVMRILNQSSTPSWIAAGVLAGLSAITFANFLKIPVVANWIPASEAWLARRLRPPID